MNFFFTRNDDKSAIIVHSLNGTESISYKELQAQASAKSINFTQGEIVGFCDKISLDLIINYIAAMAAGAIPLFVAHPSTKVPQLVWEHRLNNLKKLGVTKILSKEFELNANKQNIVDNLLDILFIQTSSGTTNNQKAFCISREKLKNQILNYSKEIDFADKSVVVSWLPLYHDMGLITSLFMPLHRGATSVIIPTFDWVFKNNLLFECIDYYEATHCWMPNFAFELMCKSDFLLQNKVCKFYNCSEVCRKSSVEKFYGKYFNSIFCTYAMAENVFAATTSARVQQGELREILSSGCPINGTNIKIENGQIFLSGNSLFDGFLRDGKIDKFTEQWYATGDTGELVDGELFVYGRGDESIKLYGKQINLLDIESHLNNQAYCNPGRCVSVLDDERLVIMYEGDKENYSAILHSIYSIFDVSGVVEWVPNNSLIKTSSGKLSRNLNLNYYKNRIFVRAFIGNELLKKNIPQDVGLRSCGAFDSFSIVEIWCKINMQLKRQIDWSLNFQSLNTIEDFVNAI